MKSIYLCLLITLLPLHAAETTPPNIVLLFSDDAGYADFGFHGSTSFPTPHLDALAARGVIFEQLYVTAAVCGPSRAGLHTGQYQQRFGFEENNVPGLMDPAGLTGDDMGLPLSLPTMADHLKSRGYRTALFGKWHMGNADRYHPLKRGFDEFYGFRDGARSFFAYEDGDAMRPSQRMERGFGEYAEPTGYLTDVLAAETCDFIERHQNQPFFAFVSFNAVHTPMEPDPQFADMFPELEGKRRKLAQMNWSLDLACGRIVQKLRDLGLEDNTLIIFTNDNGGPTDANRSNNYPLSGTKANHLEGGIRVPGIMVWPGQIEAGTRYPHPTSTLDFLPTFMAAAKPGTSARPEWDGVDLMPHLTGQDSSRPHRALFWKKENRGVIRRGDWKLIRYPDRPAELYHIPRDPAEQHNLAADHPELVRELFSELFAWEGELKRPLWQLERRFETKAAERMDTYRTHSKDMVR